MSLIVNKHDCFKHSFTIKSISFLFGEGHIESAHDSWDRRDCHYKIIIYILRD